jgi:TRAP-type mannitol/chloroaromatic compound transport system substrate-binding protein
LSKIKEMTDGQFQIKLYGGGELVPPPGAFDAVSKGTVQMGSGSPYFWAGKSTAFNWFGSIPFLILQLIGLTIIAIWPVLVTWLPGIVYGH